MNTQRTFWIMIGVSVTLGLLIYWLDSQSQWDDTGITAGLIFITPLFFGFSMPRFAWVWALTIGIWVPIAGILVHHDFAFVFVLVIAFLGSYIGALVRKAVKPPASEPSSHNS
jgi:hypothetical protein